MPRLPTPFFFDASKTPAPADRLPCQKRGAAETAGGLTPTTSPNMNKKAKTALETKCHRLEKLWETERKGRDVLDHARAQKEKHVCVLLKERDRLEREVKALRRKGETPTPRKVAAPVTPTDVPSPVKMRPLVVATPSPQKDALELLEAVDEVGPLRRALEAHARRVARDIPRVAVEVHEEQRPRVRELAFDALQPAAQRLMRRGARADGCGQREEEDRMHGCSDTKPAITPASTQV